MRKLLDTSLLFVLVVVGVAYCNGSTLLDVDSHNESTIPPKLQSINSNETNINLLYFTIFNDLPYADLPVKFYFNHYKTPEYILKYHETFGRFANPDTKSCLMIHRAFYIQFDVYDPKAAGKKHSIYYIVKWDGLYSSWDNKNFDLVSHWHVS